MYLVLPDKVRRCLELASSSQNIYCNVTDVSSASRLKSDGVSSWLPVPRTFTVMLQICIQRFQTKSDGVSSWLPVPRTFTVMLQMYLAFPDLSPMVSLAGSQFPERLL
ncbi:hypothetical protein RRG08_047191 [Elysia crispata]|uniref:Uncharacterized protein n=1 Tax=Elysia crispata TaxID=231223 RepID=A0AAE0Z499_9GAST|nr:hypothetical protein RRG08_047191 [Elysia crispata]